MANEVATLNGLYKDRYADKVKDLVPDHVKLYNAVKFDTSKKVGDAYVEPVILSLESGFTYGGEDGGLFNLEDAKEFKMKKATVKARELVLRSAISIGALNRAASNEQSIERAMDLMVGNMLKSIYHRLEVQMFYGQSGIGEVKTANSAVATEKIIEIKDSEWAAGLWNGTTGAQIEIFDSALAAVVHGSGPIQVKGYSLKNKTVTIELVSGASFASPADDIAATDVIYFKGAAEAGAVKNEFLGIHGISQETSNLFGVANANEPLFQGSVVDVGTSGTPVVLSQGKIEEGISSMVEKGLMSEEVSVYVNPKQWDDLLSEQDAKRRHTSVTDGVKSGAREIEFFGQNGNIVIKASTFVKQGYAYIIAEKDLKRIGSTEVTFKRPDGEEFFKLLEGKNGVEMRCITDQSLFTSRPSSICQLRYILAE